MAFILLTVAHNAQQYSRLLTVGTNVVVHFRDYKLLGFEHLATKALIAGVTDALNHIAVCCTGVIVHQLVISVQDRLKE